MPEAFAEVMLKTRPQELKRSVKGGFNIYGLGSLVYKTFLTSVKIVVHNGKKWAWLFGENPHEILARRPKDTHLLSAPRSELSTRSRFKFDAVIHAIERKKPSKTPSETSAPEFDPLARKHLIRQTNATANFSSNNSARRADLGRTPTGGSGLPPLSTPAQGHLLKEAPFSESVDLHMQLSASGCSTDRLHSRRLHIALGVGWRRQTRLPQRVAEQARQAGASTTGSGSILRYVAFIQNASSDETFRGVPLAGPGEAQPARRGIATMGAGLVFQRDVWSACAWRATASFAPRFGPGDVERAVLSQCGGAGRIHLGEPPSPGSPASFPLARIRYSASLATRLKEAKSSMDGAGDSKTLIWGAWTTHQQLSEEELEGRATRDRGEAWTRCRTTISLLISRVR
ncbi:hypothetical protein C8R45DRAFT_924211 [Mycena sanguinolenta]|nr:hypothetical protein C8R45DRAFT_924211 [Mycena sanguinolenta]